MGRVIDRVGQTRVLLVAAAFTALSGTFFVVAVLEGASLTLVTVLAIVAGLCVPRFPLAARAAASLVGRERLDTAFALDALTLELVSSRTSPARTVPARSARRGSACSSSRWR